MTFIDGYKTKIGAVLISIGIAIYENPELCPIEELRPFVKPVGSILFGGGAGAAVWGIANKAEKIKTAIEDTKK